MPGAGASVELFAELAALGILRAAQQHLPEETIGGVDVPVKVGPDEAIVAAALDLARTHHHTAERVSETAAQTPEGHERTEILRHELGALRSRQDHAPAPAILGHEERVGIRSLIAGGAHPPGGRVDAARVRGRDRRGQQIGSFEEERALLRKRQREAVVDVDLRHVGFDLREIGIERGVERQTRARAHLKSSPRSLSNERFGFGSSRLPAPVKRSLTFAVEYGAIVKWLPVGSPSNPDSSEAWQRKQPEFLGMGVLAMM